MTSGTVIRTINGHHPVSNTDEALVRMESKRQCESFSPDAGAVTLALPESLIVDILMLMTPLDACRLSATSRSFRSAAESDALWKSFLPPDYMEILSRSSDSSSRRDFSSMKELFFSLCDSPLLIDGGRKSFWLEKKRGKKCYMSAARDLNITDSPENWVWTSVPESRFPEVAVSNGACLFEVRDTIESRMLSPGTRYAAYLVLGVRDPFRFEDCNVTAFYGAAGKQTIVNIIYLDANTSDGVYPEKRKDGFWYEIKLGEYFNEGEENLELKIVILQLHGHWKRGITIEGIEIRPKDDL